MADPDPADNYTQPEGYETEPPRGWLATLRYLGPSVIISATIVGSGEIILTASLGAAVGYAMLWWVLFSCWSKSLLQAELARYIVVTGDTYLRAINRAPGRIPGPRGSFAWPVGLGVIGFATGLTGLGGLIGGSGLAVSLMFPDIDARVAVGVLAVVAAVLLGTGSYHRLERVMLAFVVTFTLLTITGAVMMQGTGYATRATDLLAGLQFEFEPSVAVLALAAYGYTGVNAGEISSYSYWCIEKGYPRRIGRYDGSDAWAARANGWLRVLRTDVWVTLAILTCATVPFYLLGAGVLHAIGEAPGGTGTIVALSHMYTETLGPWSLWLFGIGAFCILYSSTVAGLAAGARYIPDYLIELGFLSRDSLKVRYDIIRWYGVVAPFLGFGLYLGVERPVMMVTVAACYAALLLPIQSGLTLYLHATRLPASVRPRPLTRFALQLTFVVQLLLALAVIYFVVF